MVKFTCGLALVALMLFLSAGTWNDPGGWLLLGLLFTVIPLVLGSWYALIAVAFYLVIITVRLKDEEALLTKELPGYAEYKKEGQISAAAVHLVKRFAI